MHAIQNLFCRTSGAIPGQGRLHVMAFYTALSFIATIVIATLPHRFF